ncbi:MAG: DUF1501 domain-containing protein [Myxococcota bacterium]|nr:DUF1501 domain-containing protein [Myxococcota bacterium]
MKKQTKNLIGRRRFLQTLAATGAATSFSLWPNFTPLSHAQSHHPDAPDRYYIFCYFPGGWDVLLSLDPRDPAVFTNGNLRSTQIQPGYELLQNTDGRLIESGGITFGPHIGELANHASRISVVRGMSMDTLTHEVGRRRFLTGKAPSGLQARGSSAATWLASHFGGQEPIPNLAVQVESYNKGLENYATALSANSVSDLLRALRPAEPNVSARVMQQLNARLSDAALCPRSQRSSLWQSAEASRKKAREMVVGNYGDAFDFRANTLEMQALRTRFGFNQNQTNSPEVRGAMAVQAITTGISRCVSLSVCGGLDTHFDDWQTNQGANQEQGFRVVSRIIEELDARQYGDSGESWLDRTVIVGFSEFTRTPLINTRGGRDHALMNACFLAGGSVRGGTVIGRSSDVGMQPTTTNLYTGEFDQDGEVIRPEHVLQTLFDEVGIGEEPDLRVPECRGDLLDPCEQRIAIPRLLRS